jgi:hypothetical protein
MNYEDILAKKAEAEKVVRGLRKQLKDTGGKFLVEIFAHLFEKYPKVKGYTWNQYTPYFNDGDECTFRCCYDDGSVIVEKNGEEVTVDWRCDDEDLCEEMEDVTDEFVKTFPSFSDDDMRDFFGDHATVTIRPTGVEVSHYDHD